MLDNKCYCLLAEQLRLQLQFFSIFPHSYGRVQAKQVSSEN